MSIQRRLTMKIRKATDTEKKLWSESKQLYPLFGYTLVKGRMGGVISRWSCAIEYLGEGTGEPNYELHAPDGMRFTEGTHTLLGTTQDDLAGRCPYLEVCSEVGCDDHDEVTK